MNFNKIHSSSSSYIKFYHFIHLYFISCALLAFISTPIFIMSHLSNLYIKFIKNDLNIIIFFFYSYIFKTSKSNIHIPIKSYASIYIHNIVNNIISLKNISSILTLKNILIILIFIMILQKCLRQFNIFNIKIKYNFAKPKVD